MNKPQGSGEAEAKLERPRGLPDINSSIGGGVHKHFVKSHQILRFCSSETVLWHIYHTVRRDSKEQQAGGAGGDCLLVEVLDAVDEAASIHGERDAVQAAVAHHTGKAVRVIGLPSGSENALHDGFGAHAALLQGILRRKRKTPMISRDSRHSIYAVIYSMTRNVTEHIGSYAYHSQHSEEDKVYIFNIEKRKHNQMNQMAFLRSLRQYVANVGFKTYLLTPTFVPLHYSRGGGQFFCKGP